MKTFVEANEKVITGAPTFKEAQDILIEKSDIQKMLMNNEMDSLREMLIAKTLSVLNENQYAPLYHATYYVNLLSIMNDGMIKPNKLGYIFLTRDKNYKVGGDYATPIVFKVDQEKIRQRYKIRPRVGNIANKNQRIEAEEVVKGKIPLEWVQEIQVPKAIIIRIKDGIEAAENQIIWAKGKYENTHDPKYLDNIKNAKSDIETYNKVLKYPNLKVV